MRVVRLSELVHENVTAMVFESEEMLSRTSVFTNKEMDLGRVNDTYTRVEALPCSTSILLVR